MTDATTTTAATEATSRDAFLLERQPRWDRLAALCAADARHRSANDLRLIAMLYRSTSGDLALARAQFPNDPMLPKIEALLVPARVLVYRRVPKRWSLREFYSTQYWRRITERPGLTGVAIALMVLPAVAIFFWALRDPERAATLLGGRFSGGRTSWGDQGYSAEQASAIATQIFTNNIQVSFLAFAGGILLCLGTGYLLLFNGAILGLVAGTSTAQGHGDVAFTLIVAHGVLELSVIIVTSVAGMRLGWAIIEPGRFTRAQALRNEALAAIEIVLGTIPFFVLAGLVEGYFTPAGFGPVWAGVVGVALGGAYWALAVVRSRVGAATPAAGRTAGPPPVRARR